MKPSFAASLSLFSQRKTFFTTPVSDTSPRKIVRPREIFCFELTIAITQARSTHGSVRLIPRATLIYTSEESSFISANFVITATRRSSFQAFIPRAERFG